MHNVKKMCPAPNTQYLVAGTKYTNHAAYIVNTIGWSTKTVNLPKRASDTTTKHKTTVAQNN
mgnify:CR=1 FL=1